MKASSSLVKGLSAGLPIAVGYIPIAITYGLIAKSQGLPLWFIMMLSLTTFAGSSQFIALQLIASGAGLVEIVFTTFVVNFRNFLMASAVSLRGPSEYPWAKRVLTGMTVTDETFAVVSGQKREKLPFAFVLGLQGILYAAWNGGSLLGAAVVGDVSTLWRNSLGIAIYAMFISMVLPIVRSDRTTGMVAGITGLLSCGLYLFKVNEKIGNSSVLLVCAVIGAAVGAAMKCRGAAADE